MRPGLVGLAVVASLATPLLGACDSGGVPSASWVCGDEEGQHPCDDQYAEEALYDIANRADVWADANLGMEYATATYWRDPMPREDLTTGERMGRLYSLERGPNRGPIRKYVCDKHYEDASSGGCVPSDRDYDCWELRSWGIVNIPVIRLVNIPGQEDWGEDWMLLDDDHDDWGCELYPAAQ